MDDAWRLVSEGEYIAAQHRFAQATSRINSDFVHVVSHYLQSKGCETFQAPYFAASQLSYFTQVSLGSLEPNVMFQPNSSSLTWWKLQYNSCHMPR